MNADGLAGASRRGGRASPPRYQLALSYADADADYARKAAAELIDRGVTLFTRSDDRLLGRNLSAEIQRIYRDEVGHAILFVSGAYVADKLARVELRAALDRTVREDGFVLPARFDGTDVPGLDRGTVALSLVTDAGDTMSPAEFAERVVSWLGDQDGEIRRRSTLAGWSRFDPAKLHCVVVDAEAGSDAGNDRLGAVFTRILGSAHGREIWESAYSCLQATETLRGRRDLPDDFRLDLVPRATIPVADAVASADGLDHAVRLIVEADLALFDVTHFEPAVMLLLGIRAATRRGVTVVSHGDGWAEGAALDRPFNLSDLSIASHARLSVGTVGSDPRVPRIAERIRTGFDQLRRQPHYHDLPVYDALRGLGPDLAARAPIPVADEVLMLCSYDESHDPVWSDVQAEIGNGLVECLVTGTTIARLQDLPTPQIVSQALYEQIRRCVGCVVDWTRASPSTFFELGVRLVASPWGTVQIAARSWLDRTVERRASDPREHLPPPSQVARMHDLLRPVVYADPPGPDLGRAVARSLVDIDRSGPTTGHRVRSTAVRAVAEVEPRIDGVVSALQESADRLDSPDRRRLVPQALFFESSEVKLDHERAAREQRLAAWLYLEHRSDAGRLPHDDPRRRQWTALGRGLADGLLTSHDAADVDLGLSISVRMSDEPTTTASLDEAVLAAGLHRRTADTLRVRGRSDDAAGQYEAALGLLDDVLDRSQGPADLSPTDRAELLGTRGGILRRLGRSEEALASYRDGAVIERRHALPSTYNRSNAIKLALISGSDELASLTTDLAELSSSIETTIRENVEAASDAWTWADLGDMLLLTGRTADAAEAYRHFSARARTDSPTTTLSVLHGIADALRDNGDPDADRVAGDLLEVERTLGGA